MARLRRRTVAPAKVSACQSEEKLWTRRKPSSVISFMLVAENGIRNRMAVFRITEKARYTPTKAAQAFQAGSGRVGPALTASTSRPAAQGIIRSNPIATRVRPIVPAISQGLRRQ
jgi:hypothetical protein